LLLSTKLNTLEATFSTVGYLMWGYQSNLWCAA
jgi:hypothetical protein